MTVHSFFFWRRKARSGTVIEPKSHPGLAHHTTLASWCFVIPSMTRAMICV